MTIDSIVLSPSTLNRFISAFNDHAGAGLAKIIIMHVFSPVFPAPGMADFNWFQGSMAKVKTGKYGSGGISRSHHRIIED